MTFEDANNLLEQQEGDYLKDGKEFAKGISLLDKYVNDGWLGNIAAEHDIIYLPGDVAKMSEQDITQLHRWGFHLESDNECWSYFT